jgi:hypothetical protein
MDTNEEKINTYKLTSKRFPKGEVLWLQYVWLLQKACSLLNQLFEY